MEYHVEAWDYELENHFFVLNKHLTGLPKLENFDMVVEEIPQLLPGEILTCAEWISIDAYLAQDVLAMMELGDPVPGTQLARVVKSLNQEFPVGTQVIGYFGWRDLTVYMPSPRGPRNFMTICPIPNMKGLPDQYCLGILGMPGVSAFWALVDVCKPRKGQTLVVTGAGGAVGSIAAQIGHIFGCRVYAFAGTEAKIKWMKANFNKEIRVYNYRNMGELGNLEESMSGDFFPRGIDCLFDLVGGFLTSQLMKYMNRGGRVAQVGTLSNVGRHFESYEIRKERFDYRNFRGRQIVIQGFNCKNYLNKANDAIYKLRDWLLQGRIKISESYTPGLRRVPLGFTQLLKGKNVGKSLAKLKQFDPKDYKSTFPPIPRRETVKKERFTRAGRAVDFKLTNRKDSKKKFVPLEIGQEKIYVVQKRQSKPDAKNQDKRKSRQSVGWAKEVEGKK